MRKQWIPGTLLPNYRAPGNEVNFARPKETGLCHQTLLSCVWGLGTTLHKGSPVEALVTGIKTESSDH